MTANVLWVCKHRQTRQTFSNVPLSKVKCVLSFFWLWVSFLHSNNLLTTTFSSVGVICQKIHFRKCIHTTLSIGNARFYKFTWKVNVALFACMRANIITIPLLNFIIASVHFQFQVCVTDTSNTSYWEKGEKDCGKQRHRNEKNNWTHLKLFSTSPRQDVFSDHEPFLWQ